MHSNAKNASNRLKKAFIFRKLATFNPFCCRDDDFKSSKMIGVGVNLSRFYCSFTCNLKLNSMISNNNK